MNIGVIPARYGSKRFPGKPLAKILNKPLLAWVIEGTKGSQLLDKVIVATDKKEICEIATKLNTDCYITPSNLPSGTDRVAFTLRNLENLKSDDVVINIQGDEPLIRGDVLDLLISEMLKNPGIEIATLARKSKEPGDSNNVKVVFDNRGFALYFSRSPIPYFREGQPFYWLHIGVYGFRVKTLFRFVNLKESKLEKIEKLEQLRALENGLKIKIIETDFVSIPVDVPEDIKKVEKVLKRRQLKNEKNS